MDIDDAGKLIVSINDSKKYEDATDVADAECREIVVDENKMTSEKLSCSDWKTLGEAKTSNNAVSAPVKINLEALKIFIAPIEAGGMFEGMIR